MAMTVHCDIVSAEEELFTGLVEMVVAHGNMGDLGILPGHTPLLTDLYETLSDFTRLEGIQTEYGPGQIETNLVYTDALEAADDAV